MPYFWLDVANGGYNPDCFCLVSIVGDGVFVFVDVWFAYKETVGKVLLTNVFVTGKMSFLSGVVAYNRWRCFFAR